MSFKLPLFASLCGLALSTATAGQAQRVGAPIAPPFTISQTRAGSVTATAAPNSLSAVAGALAVAPSAIGVLSAVTASNTTYNQLETGVVTSQIVAPAGSASNSLMIENPTGTVTVGSQAIGTQTTATGSQSDVVFNQSLVGATIQAIDNVTVTNCAVIKDQTVAFGNSFNSSSSSGPVTATPRSPASRIPPCLRSHTHDGLSPRSWQPPVCWPCRAALPPPPIPQQDSMRARWAMRR
jgi:hypothetical protein